MNRIALCILVFLISGFPVLGQAPAADATAEATHSETPSAAAETEEMTAELSEEDRRKAGEALVGEAVQALGGDAFIQQTSQIATGTGRLRPLGQAVTSNLEKLTVSKVFPSAERLGKDRIEIVMPQGTIVQAFDGKEGWVLNAGQLSDQTARLKNRRHFGYDVLRRFNEEFKARQLADEMAEDRELSVVQIKDGAGNATKFFLDQKTHRVFQVVYTLDNLEITERYTDYQVHDEVNVPMNIVLYQGSAKVLEFSVEDVQVNVDIPEQDFNKPAQP